MQKGKYQSHIPFAVYITELLPSLSFSVRVHTKNLSLSEKYRQNFCKKQAGEWIISRKGKKTEKETGLRQEKREKRRERREEREEKREKRRERREEIKSRITWHPEMTHGGKKSDISRLPSGPQNTKLTITITANYIKIHSKQFSYITRVNKNLITNYTYFALSY